MFKFIKSIAVLLLAIGFFRLLDPVIAERFAHWIAPLVDDHRIVIGKLDWLLGLAPAQVLAFGMMAVIYAMLFLVEGIGLWLANRCAEYFTTIMTSLLIPLESWEIAARPTIPRAMILFVNIAIVVYLVTLLRRSHARS